MALSKVRRFLSQHRNKFIIGGLAVGGFVMLTRYGRAKLEQLKAWHEKEAEELVNKSKKQQHFESINRTCNQTIRELSLALNDVIAKCIATESIIESLKSNPRNKIEMWNYLKVKIFSKIGCYIYLSTLLVITLRIQLSILGAHLFKNPDSVSIQKQEQYLSQCQNLLKNGVGKLHTIMQEACKNVLATVTLTKQIRLSDLETLFWSIQTAVEDSEDSPVKNIKDYVLTDDTTQLQTIHDMIPGATLDLLESEEVKSVAHHCISRGIILFVDLLSEYYADDIVPAKVNLEDGAKDPFINPFSTNSKPLAKLLPLINSLLTQKQFPDRLIQMLVVNDKIRVLGANIYEAFM